MGDPTRLAILSRLRSETTLSVSQIAEPFAVTLPAVMKHLDVLSEAGLVIREKIGRTVTVRLRHEPLKKAHLWLDRYQCFWTPRLDRLAIYAEGMESRKKCRD